MIAVGCDDDMEATAVNDLMLSKRPDLQEEVGYISIGFRLDCYETLVSESRLTRLGFRRKHLPLLSFISLAKLAVPRQTILASLSSIYKLLRNDCGGSCYRPACRPKTECAGKLALVWLEDFLT